LNKHEINYTTTQKELLAVVFGEQTHRCFLYGRRFKVIGYHAALKWLITVKNHQCDRLTRWVLKLSEYDFEIVYRPGKKHLNADVLSRHIAATVRKSCESHGDKKADVKPQPETALTKDFITQSQVGDEYCQEIDQGLIEGKDLPFFWDNDSVLYYKLPNTAEEPKIVVPIALREQVIRLHHDPVFAGHQGEKRTINNIRLKYYWPSMS
jgi:hypothetical protein